MNIYFSQYVGIPYDEANCWDVIRRVYEDALRIDLPEKIYDAAPEFTEVWFDDGSPLPELRAFDLLLMRKLRPYVEHVAVAIDADRYLHGRRRTGSCIEPVARWQQKIAQVVRHGKLQ